jgi:integrase
MNGRRRGSGEGTIYRRADGKWVAMLDLGWENGKRRRRAVYGKTRAEVATKLKELHRAQEDGVDLAAKPRTLAEWLDEWLNDIKAKDGTQPSTLDRYRLVVRLGLVPALGKIRVDKLTVRDVQRFLTAKGDTSSPGGVAKIHAVLRAALSDAVRFELVSRNVAKAVKLPSSAAAERRVPTPEEIRQLFAAAEGDRLGEVFRLAVLLGLRRGELLGLRWTDVDLEERFLVVRTTIQRSGGQLRVAEPKTRRSARRIRLSQSAVRAFERQRIRQAKERLAAGSAWQDQGWVFASQIGTPTEPRNLSRRFVQIRHEAGLDWLHLHDLRHACGTYLIAEGVDLRTVMEVLGHSTFRLTMDTYAHVLDGQLHTAADAMDRAFGED